VLHKQQFSGLLSCCLVGTLAIAFWPPQRYARCSRSLWVSFTSDCKENVQITLLYCWRHISALSEAIHSSALNLWRKDATRLQVVLFTDEIAADYRR